MNFFSLLNLKNQRNLIYFLALTAAMLLNSCNIQNNSPDISFYYWKTRFSLSSIESKILNNYQVKKLYIRYFDIDLDGNNHPIPVSPLIFEQNIENLKVVPVIYIKNKVFTNSKTDISQLAEKTHSLISQINKKNKIDIDEIQLDCDWTAESCKMYFNFIDAIRKMGNFKISATIRLHQVKYFRQTKIPPVDEGVLMYYNMGQIATDNTNSIYERQTAKKYIGSMKNYPLQLNIALPIFAWGIHIRNGKTIDLINKMDIGSFETDTHFVELKKNRLKAKSNCIKFGYYFKEGDEIKTEQILPDDLLEMAGDLNKNLKQTPHEIIFYDLDSINLKRYDNENQFFKEIIDHF